MLTVGKYAIIRNQLQWTQKNHPNTFKFVSSIKNVLKSERIILQIDNIDFDKGKIQI